VQRLASILLARRGLALALLAAAVLVTAGIASLLPVRYAATAQVLVGGAPGAAPDGRADADARATLLATQADIVTSGRVALRVVDALRLASDPATLERWRRATDGQGAVRHFAADHLLERVRARPGRDSGLLSIVFYGDDPGAAARGANAFARAYVDTLAEIREEAARRAADAGARRADAPGGALDRLEAVVLDPAREPGRADGPGAGPIAAIGLLAGMLLALVGVSVAEARQPGVRTAGDVARAIGDRAGAPVTVEGLRTAGPLTGSASVRRGDRSSPRSGSAPVHGPDGRAAFDLETGTLLAPDGVETGTFAPRSAGRTPPAPGAARAMAPVADLQARRAGLEAGRAATPAGAAVAAARGPSDTAATPARAPAGAAGTGPAPGPAGGAPVAFAPDRGRPREPIGELLVRAGLIHPPEVERTLAWARQEGLRFGEAAVARQLLTPLQLERALARQFDYPLLETGRSDVSPEVVAAFDAHAPLLADLRRIRARLDGASVAGVPPARCVAMVAPGDGAGRSFLAANLAVCFAQAGRRTLLVDADLRAGRQHVLFGLANRTGLSAMLNHRIDPGALQRVAGLRDLTVVSCGPQAPNPAELLSRDTFGQLVASFRQAYDRVILDTSGIADEPDAVLVARQAGAAVLVARRDATTQRALAATARSLHDDRVAIVAAVLNRA
jgi:protein-tyrosine kinase